MLIIGLISLIIHTSTFRNSKLFKTHESVSSLVRL